MRSDEEVRNAIRIFRHCLDHKGVLIEADNPELFGLFQDTEVRSYLSMFEEEMNLSFLLTGNRIYLIPSFDNTTLGMSLREYREDIGMTTRLESAFLVSYIQMIIFWLFFGGKNNNPKQRDFIQMKDLIEAVDEMFDRLTQEKDTVLDFDNQYRFNFRRIAEAWKNKTYGGEGQETTTKSGSVRRAVNQLRDHNLLTLVENEVRPTQELTEKFLYYYLREERVKEIHDLFDRVEEV